MTDSNWEIHGQRALFGNGWHSSWTDNTEADRIYLVDASARDHNDRSPNGYVSGSERGERNGQTASLKRACVFDRLAVTRQAAPRGNGIQKARVCT